MTEQIKIKAIPLVEGYGFFQPTQEKIAAGNLLRDLRQWYGSEVSNIHAQLYVLTFPGNNESGDKKTMYMAIVDPAGQNSDGDVRNVAILEQDNPAIGDRFALQAAKKKVEDDKEVYIFSLANSKNHTDSLIGYELEVSSLDNKKVDKLVIRDSEGRVLVSVDSTTMAENSEKTQEGQVPLYNSFFINRGGTYRKAVNMADTSVMTEDAHDRARKRTLDK